jgi:hypothetical protein
VIPDDALHAALAIVNGAAAIGAGIPGTDRETDCLDPLRVKWPRCATTSLMYEYNTDADGVQYTCEKNLDNRPHEP